MSQRRAEAVAEPFFLYLKQTGEWISAVSGLNPETDRPKLTPLCPVRNVTAGYPPTLLLHAADKDAPIEQSLAMAEELKRHTFLPHPCGSRFDVKHRGTEITENG